MLKRLILKNYRLYESLDISFDMLELISGANGSGKTTIVEAISFAMFGSTMQRGKKDSWIKRGKSGGSVTLFIDDFEIFRSNKLATVTDKDGNVVARNNTGIVAWMEQHYGLTAELYKTSFYIGQKDIDSFASLSPLERTKRVERLLRINELDELKQQARELARAADANLNVYTSKLEGLDMEFSNLASYIEDLNRLQVELSDNTTLLEKALVLQGEYNAKLAKWQRKLTLLKQFNGETYDLEVLQAAYDEVVKFNAKVASTNKLVREKASLVEKLAKANVNEKYFTCDTIALVTHKNNFIKAKKLQGNINELKAAGIVPKIVDQQAITEQIAKLREQLKHYNNTPTVCPTCKQPWPEKVLIDPEAVSLELDKLIHEKEKLAQQKELAELQQELSSLPENPFSSLSDLEQAIRTTKLTAEYNRLTELYEVGTEEIEPKAQLVDMAFVRQQVSIANELEILKNVEEPEPVDTTQLRNNNTILKNKVSTAQTKINHLELDKAIFEEYNDLEQTTRAKRDQLLRFIKFIDRYRKAFGNNVIPLIESNVSKIVNYLTAGKYEKIEIEPDYAIKDFDFYSGSEQDSISFALRLAISQVSRLGSFKTMLLDEVAASFDTDKEKLLIDVLRQQPNQLLYITHGEVT